jgi:hypothetical protein
VPVLRGAGTLVATLLVVLLFGIALTGGRLLRDWNGFVHPSAPASSPAIDARELSQLEATPLQLPSLAPGATCPVGPASGIVGYGAGPISGIGPGVPSSTVWGHYFRATLVMRPDHVGPILIRARALGDNGVIVFVGQYTAGPAVGSDTLDGKQTTQHPELILDPRHPPHTPPLSGFSILGRRQATWCGTSSMACPQSMSSEPTASAGRWTA